MDDARVLAAFREELIALGVGRRPSEPGAPEGRPYPVVIEPGDGAPAPRELPDGDYDHDELIVTLLAGGDLSEATGYEARQRRRAVVDVHYRALGNPALREVFAVDNLIRLALTAPERNYGYGFELGDESLVYVHQAAVWAGLGPISRGPQGFHHVAKWMLEVPPA